MSNSNDMGKGAEPKKFEEHPDFEELLKAEESRLAATKKEDNAASPKVSAPFDDSADDEFDSIGHFEDDDASDLGGSEASSSEGPKDFSDFSDVASTVPHFEEEGEGHALDDSMEFNFDDASDGKTEEIQAKNTVSQTEPMKKKSSGMLFYAVIGVVVLVGAIGIYMLFSPKPAPQAAPRASASPQGVGFKPVLPAVHPLANTLPPAVPQTTAPVVTAMTSDQTDEQLIPASIPGSNGNAMVQVNRQQLLGLLAGFKKTVADGQKTLAADVSSMKETLGKTTSSNSEALVDMKSRLDQMAGEIQQENQTLDTYNKAISGVQSSLEKTQQQLKLILAERAEDIDHYTLRAVVPGRFWLVDGQGRTVTLTQGQDLKNYGTVQEINDKLGTVTMSSGYVFK